MGRSQNMKLFWYAKDEVIKINLSHILIILNDIINREKSLNKTKKNLFENFVCTCDKRSLTILVCKNF